jgi:hypothetical protein
MPNSDPVILGLQALAWVAGQPDVGPRLLAMTGLDAERLCETADAPATLAAVLAFLDSHEPDLVACADALGVRPQELLAARASLDA